MRILILLAGLSLVVSCTTADLSKVVLKTPDLTKSADGVYHGTGTVEPVSAQVELEMKAGRIVRFEVLGKQDGFSKPAEALAALVVEHQTVELDAITGATYSSKAILLAGEHALETAVDQKLSRP